MPFQEQEESQNLHREEEKKQRIICFFNPSSTWTKTYMKARGAMTTAKMGVLEMITIMVERETKKVPRNMSTVAGRASSIT